MREFMGLDVHTVQFKPDLYAPVCRQVRDYHPIDWDFGDDPAKPPEFPMTVNGVNWETLYGSWRKDGFDIDACLMFDNVAPDKWKDPARDARAYGKAFAAAFGPSGKWPRVSCVEVGNEPAKYSDAQYRSILEPMASGLREGDPKLKIATCAVMTGSTDQWSKPVSCLQGLDGLYDVLSIHSYPFKERWPTWRRSYPEDPSIPFLKSIEDLIRWRDANAPGKQVWLTEFGYDSATHPPAADGPWKQWVGVTDEQQARYIVRAFLVLSSIGLDRAYLYFFNDEDQPQLHGASGLTRRFQPKPSYYAMSYLYRTLGETRFARALRKEDGGVYCFEFSPAESGGDTIYVAWLAKEAADPVKTVLPVDPTRIVGAERMPMGREKAERVAFEPAEGQTRIALDVTPVFIRTR